MASIRKQKKTWFACITLANGERTQRSTGQRDVGTPKERATIERNARLIAQEMEEVARGNKVEAQIRKTVGDLFQRVTSKRLEFAKTEAFFRDWLSRVKIRKSDETVKRYVQIAEEFLAYLGERASVPISDIVPADIQGYIDASLVAGKRPKTARNEARILNAPFSFALRQGLILTNPVASADIPEDPGESKSPFTAAQVSAILRAATGDWKTVALFGAYTGARLKDCANMTHGNVDFPNKLLRYRPQKTKRHKKDVVVPLHPRLEAHLLSLSSSDQPGKPLAPTLAGKYTGGRTGLSQQFEKIMTAAGIENEPIAEGKGRGRDFKPLGFHSFRHTFKTTLVNAGVEVVTVDVLIGHAKKSVSETYIHRSSELLRSAVAKLPAF